MLLARDGPPRPGEGFKSGRGTICHLYIMPSTFNPNGARVLSARTQDAAAVPVSRLALDRSRLRVVRDRNGRAWIVYVFGPAERPFRLTPDGRTLDYPVHAQPAGFLVGPAETDEGVMIVRNRDR